MIATRAPTVIPAIAPGLNPPELLDGGGSLAIGVSDGADDSVITERVSVFVMLGVGLAALGEALALSASRSAARRSKVLFVSEILREAQEGSSIASGIGLGNWPMSVSLRQLIVHFV